MQPSVLIVVMATLASGSLSLSSAHASGTHTVSSATGLLADRSNLRSGKPSERFAIGENGHLPTLMWIPQHEENDQQQAAYQIRVFQSHDQHGIASTDVVWDSGMVKSPLPRAQYQGPQLRGRTYYSWTCRWWDSSGHVSPWAATAEFHFAPQHLLNSSWISATSANINLFRAPFTLPVDSTRVTLYICGLGYSYASVNGESASDQLLMTSQWSNNERRNVYSSIDITNISKAGSNVLGVALGNGYRDQSSFPRLDQGENAYDKTMITLWAQVHVVSSSGHDVIVLDTASGTWMGAAGPVVQSSVYNGETYDARMEMPGWDTESFNAASWVKLDVSADPPRGVLAPWMGPPVTLDKVVKPVSVTQPHPGIFVVDFGINQAGVCRLSNIKLPKGSNVTLRHGEILQHKLLPDLKTVDPTMPYYGNLRTAKATDVYIAKGDSDGEVFYPRFTYHGFRYVEVTGLHSLTEDDIEMHHFHSAVETQTIPSFKAPVLNKIYAMAVGAQRSNMMTVQTDCDQRDERLGWMGDANLSGDSLALNFKYGAFLLSFLKVMIDELNADGSSVDVSPNVRYGGRPGDISWTTATIAYPYAAYKAINDLGPAKTYLDSMLNQINNIDTQCKGVAGTTCPTKYGDWVPPNPPGQGQGPKPSKPFTSAFSFVDAVAKVGELAAALGNTAVADELSKKHAKLSSDFNLAFASANGTYDNGVMTTYTLPLHLGIVPNDTKSAVQKNLLDVVATTNHDHNMCGIIGMKFLFEQLAMMGREDTALAVLESTTYPSIGFMAYNSYEPATENTWELWDAYSEGVGMNSRNHHMFSSFSKYMIEHIAGLKHSPDTQGFRQIELTAASEPGLAGASVSAALDHGAVKFEWQRAGGIHCARVPLGVDAELNCGSNGGIIESVRFASWGTPFGSCGSFGVSTECNIEVIDIVKELCLGKSNCTVSASESILGMPHCSFLEDSGELPRFNVEVECTGLPQVTSHATVPLASRATLRIPSAGMSGASISLSSKVGDIRIETDEHNREFVAVNLGSGQHSISFGATRAAQTVDATVADLSASLVCPVGHRVGRIRFASFGNPKRISFGASSIWHRGSCHVASVIADAEESCLGRSSCEVKIDRSRIARYATCIDQTSTLAVQAECTVSPRI